MAKLSVENFALAAAGSFIDFAAIDQTFDAGGHVSLTGGGDLQINDAGIYAIHFMATGIATGAAVSAKLFVAADVTSGSNGLWSGASAGDDFGGSVGIQIRAVGPFDIDISGDMAIISFVAWATADTFPVVVQTFAQYTEDNVGVAKSPDFRLTAVRLGAGDQ